MWRRSKLGNSPTRGAQLPSTTFSIPRVIIQNTLVTRLGASSGGL